MDFIYIIEVLPYILSGLKVTLIVFVLTVLISIPIGIVMGSLVSLKLKLLTAMISMYTWIFRGTPLLLQLYFGMYGLPVFGIVLSRMTVAVLIFSLNYGAYFTEIFHGSIESIDLGQSEVSKTLGFSKLQTFVYIVIPQALRRSIKSATNEIITLIKDTSLVAAIALNDILRNAKEVVSRDFRIEPFFVIGLIYISLTLLIVVLSKKTEQKFSFYR